MRFSLREKLLFLAVLAPPIADTELSLLLNGFLPLLLAPPFDLAFPEVVTVAPGRK
jgi:hypothetical protein